MVRFTALALVALPLLALADRPQIFHLDDEGEKEWGYAKAVRIDDTLYLSGTTGGRGATMEEQVKIAYERIQRTLEHFGAGFDDVVKETIFTTDIEALKQARDVRTKFYGAHTPASSWIGVERLFVPELKIEIEVIVNLDKD
jgi:enamine deaminase RidA (YjgF/YER057c/UK114 family)